ncbi:peptidase MA family metallohydrolase [Reticulibacter mediterranei]|uniref:peptidase MA family metallohydrolase n=1 Tax=Reticulibacter mediterranei TaxID=2778369 RepID=UPI001C6877EF|nr:peptidase MA family metallohydrolase [Reticulibacter mediterranei]
MVSRCNHGCRILLICFSLCLISFFASLTFSLPAQAASDPITITSQTSTITFPKIIDFQVSARDNSSPIVQASIVLIVEGDNQQQQAVTVSAPATSITLNWSKDTTGDQFEPVGTSITYYWVLRDQIGNMHIGTRQTLSMVDTRFNWQQLSQDNLQIHWYNQPQSFGQDMLQEASKDLTSISANLGGKLRRPINLWIYQNTDDFHSSLPPNTREWVGGIAFPSLSQASLVVESMNSDTINRDMPHEMTHLVFHQLTEKGIYAPIWFDEGLAVYNQVYHEPMMTLSLKQALKSHSLLPLNDLTFQFPADANKAYLAYAQSWNLIDYMYTTFGKQKMAALIQNINTPKSNFNQDLLKALGVDQAHLENQWHLALNQPATLNEATAKPTPLSVQKPQPLLQSDPNTPLLLSLGLLLIVLPSLGIGGLVIYQRRSRAKAALARQAQQVVPFPPSSYYASLQTPYTGPGYHRPAYPPPSQQTSGNASRTPPSGNTWQRPEQRYINRQPDRQVPQE